MEYFLKALAKSFHLIISCDREVYEIVACSLRFSLTSTFFAVICAVPLGFLIGSRKFKGKSLLIIVLNTGMALPTVVVGLIGYAFLSRSAPLGFLNLIFTPKAVILGEFILSFPIITNLTIAAVQSVDPRALTTAKSLGAGRAQTAWTILMEARYSLIAAIIVGYGRSVSEVGSAMMLGGNIRGLTRTMTTAIALETSKGEFGLGLALGFFLLLVIFSVNILFHYFQIKGRRSSGS
ncbi:MAG: ABC transporter permease [bacterium]